MGGAGLEQAKRETPNFVIQIESMTTAALDNQLQKYWPLLGKEEKRSILTVIKGYVKDKEAQHSRPTIEEYNREIEAAEARIEAGFFTTHEDVLKESESW
jgi:hypothetical protein